MRRSGTAAILVLAVGALDACRGSRGALFELDGSSIADANPFSTLDAGSAGYALSFDGVEDYATAADGQFSSADGDQTIEMWIEYPSVSSTAEVDVFVARLDFASGLEVGFHAGALAVWRVYVDRVLAQAPVLPSTNTWHHVAYTLESGMSTLYVDGAAVDSENSPTDGRTPTSVWLGTLDGTSQFYNGLLDEVRVWNVARTGAEVMADMLHTAPGAVPGLVAYWTFDDIASGGRALDASGNGNTVTLGDGVAERMPLRVVSDAPVSP
ncbi:MAG TPA: LamG domain-containing protein [Polyangia bacterium]|nr:LamG domain-containing protein [Polyangia bacterium]